MHLEATSRTPEVTFNENQIEIKGECYPEDISIFSEPIIEALHETIQKNDSITVEIAMRYFNSSSAKFFFDFFEILEDAASDGKSIDIDWKYRKNDTSMMEAGEDFEEDMEESNFQLVEIDS